MVVLSLQPDEPIVEDEDDDDEDDEDDDKDEDDVEGKPLVAERFRSFYCSQCHIFGNLTRGIQNYQIEAFFVNNDKNDR